VLLAVDHHVGVGCDATHQHVLNRTCRFHTRHAFHRVEHALIEHALIGVGEAGRGQFEPEERDALRIKAQVHRAEVRHRAEQEQRADEQRHRDADL